MKLKWLSTRELEVLLKVAAGEAIHDMPANLHYWRLVRPDVVNLAHDHNIVDLTWVCSAEGTRIVKAHERRQIKMKLFNVLHIAGPFRGGSDDFPIYGIFLSLDELREALIEDPKVAGFSDGQSPTDEYSVIDVTWEYEGKRAEGKLAWRVQDTLSTPAPAPEEPADG